MTERTTPTAETADDEGTERMDGMRPETANLAVPASANPGETAAIAAALSTYLRDRAAAGAASDTPEQCNRWKLCGRFGGRTPPREVVHGEEWKAAGRARW